MERITEGYIELAGAIVRRAIVDYKEALRKNSKRKISNCERFFLSEYGRFLTMENGEKIIEMCREEVKAETKEKE